MSKTVIEALKNEGGALLFLTPEEIVIDEDILKARPLYDLEQEQAEIEDLAKSMETNTQLEPIVVRYELAPGSTLPEDGHYHLIAGRRRRDAAMLINAGKSAKEEPYRLASVVKHGVSKSDAFKMALTENLKRKNLNPIQNAMVVKELRERFKWEGAKGTKKVSEFLQVSPAFVTTHEKLLTLDQALQSRVAKGELSAQAAFEFLNTKEDKRAEVEATARELQEAEEPSKPVITGKPGKKKALKAKHVRTASRQHAAAITLKPLNRAEIVDFWVKVQSPAYGYPNGAIHQFAKAFVMWTDGKLKDVTLKGYWDTLVAKAPRGKAEKPVKEPAKPVKRAAKKK